MNNDQKLYVLDRLYLAKTRAECPEIRNLWQQKIREFENRNGGLRNDEENKTEA
jgi:hypothetical protein